MYDLLQTNPIVSVVTMCIFFGGLHLLREHWIEKGRQEERGRTEAMDRLKEASDPFENQ